MGGIILAIILLSLIAILIALFVTRKNAFNQQFATSTYEGLSPLPRPRPSSSSRCNECSAGSNESGECSSCSNDRPRPPSKRKTLPLNNATEQRLFAEELEDQQTTNEYSEEEPWAQFIDPYDFAKGPSLPSANRSSSSQSPSPTPSRPTLEQLKKQSQRLDRHPLVGKRALVRARPASAGNKNPTTKWQYGRVEQVVMWDPRTAPKEQREAIETMGGGGGGSPALDRPILLAVVVSLPDQSTKREVTIEDVLVEGEPMVLEDVALYARKRGDVELDEHGQGDDTPDEDDDGDDEPHGGADERYKNVSTTSPVAAGFESAMESQGVQPFDDLPNQTKKEWKNIEKLFWHIALISTQARVRLDDTEQGAPPLPPSIARGQQHHPDEKRWTVTLLDFDPPVVIRCDSMYYGNSRWILTMTLLPQDHPSYRQALVGNAKMNAVRPPPSSNRDTDGDGNKRAPLIQLRGKHAGGKYAGGGAGANYRNMIGPYRHRLAEPDEEDGSGGGGGAEAAGLNLGGFHSGFGQRRTGDPGNDDMGNMTDLHEFQETEAKYFEQSPQYHRDPWIRSMLWTLALLYGLERRERPGSSKYQTYEILKKDMRHRMRKSADMKAEASEHLRPRVEQAYRGLFQGRSSHMPLNVSVGSCRWNMRADKIARYREILDGEWGSAMVHPDALDDRQYLRYIILHELIHSALGQKCAHCDQENGGHTPEFIQIADLVGLPKKYQD